MKFCFLILIFAVFIACNDHGSKQETLQKKIDSLELRIADSYKPGFGDFMSGIQVHHAKLWFAGQNQNWKLADFEINEIKEALDDLKKYCTDRSEVKSLGMIDRPLDSVSIAIQQKSISLFNSSYLTLTGSCNSCHRETQHEFNVIKVPATPPFSNQDFGTQK